MVAYLIRRLLLFVPTLLGATFLVFMVMAFSPSKPFDNVARQAEGMAPGAREARLAYIEDRYGLDQPALLRYFRWLNNVSPIGFQTWAYDDPAVVEQRQLRREFRQEIEPQLREQVRTELAAQIEELETPTGDDRIDGINRATAIDLVDAEMKRRRSALEEEKDFHPLPGDLQFDKVPVKAPDLGNSFIYNRPVGDMIAEAMPVTLLLNAISLPLALVISIATGIFASAKRGQWQDWGTGGVLLALYSVPVIWVGVMAIGFLANVQFIKAFPVGGTESLTAEGYNFFPSFSGGFQRGYLLDSLWHLALPVFCLTYVQFAYLSKLTRTAMLEVLGADYIRTARAKGLKPSVVLLRHAFRNSLIPIITFLAALLPTIITGSIVVEQIFGINGMGRLTIQSLFRNDYELFLAAVVMLLILKMVSYLVADLAYAVADPRVTYT